jgi:hypothetical protein
MPIDFIRVTTTDSNAPFAVDLITLVRMVRGVFDQSDKVMDIMNHSHNGVVFTQIETLFGLPTGQGQAVFDLVNGLRLALTGAGQNSNAVSLIERVG